MDITNLKEGTVIIEQVSNDTVEDAQFTIIYVFDDMARLTGVYNNDSPSSVRYNYDECGLVESYTVHNRISDSAEVFDNYYEVDDANPNMFYMMNDMLTNANVFEFNDKGNLLYSLVNGIFQDTDEDYESDYQYDDNRNCLTSVMEKHSVDGDEICTILYTYTYDDNDKKLIKVNVRDRTNHTNVGVYEFKYDNDGNLISRKFIRDGDDDVSLNFTMSYHRVVIGDPKPVTAEMLCKILTNRISYVPEYSVLKKEWGVDVE